MHSHKVNSVGPLILQGPEHAHALVTGRRQRTGEDNESSAEQGTEQLEGVGEQ